MSTALVEARGIRVDTNTSNGWSSCTTSNICATLPAGLSFNPFGSDPTASVPSPILTGGQSLFVPDSGGGPDAQTPCVTLGCISGGWSSTVPGVAIASTSGSIQSQVVFFDLSNNPSESVYGPVTSLDDSGNPIALGPATGTAWEFEFNYNSGSVPSAASLEFGGNIYTASATVLSPSNLNEFVFYGDTLYAPTGWTETSATVSAPEIDSASAMGALSLLAGCLVVLAGGKRPLSSA